MSTESTYDQSGDEEGLTIYADEFNLWLAGYIERTRA